MERKVTIGLIQEKWDEDATKFRDTILRGIKEAADQNAQIVFLMELTINR